MKPQLEQIEKENADNTNLDKINSDLNPEKRRQTMRHLQIFILFIVLLSLFFIGSLAIDTAANGAGYCKLSEENTKCIISDVDSIDPKSEIAPSVSEKIKNLVMKNLTMKTLSKQLCEIFPKIENLTISSVGLDTIEAKALAGCKHLVAINLDYNKLTNLEVDAFSFNTRLQHLSLRGNKLDETSIPALVGLVGLKHLDFSENQFSSFMLNELTILPELEDLNLAHNTISELNLSRIFIFAPKLKKLDLTGNLFACEEVIPVQTLLRSDGIMLIDSNCAAASPLSPSKDFQNQPDGQVIGVLKLSSRVTQPFGQNFLLTLDLLRQELAATKDVLNTIAAEIGRLEKVVASNKNKDVPSMSITASLELMKPNK